MAKPKKKAAKTPPASEAFFRPFAKIAAEKKAEQAAEKKAEAAGTKGSGPPPSKSKETKQSIAKVPRAPEQPSSAPVDPDTFAIYMSGVRALGQDRATRIPLTQSKIERATPPGPRLDADAPAREQLRTLVAEGVRFETTDDGDRIEGRRLDSDPRDLRRLRRGAFAIDGRLDLHGKGITEARLAVETFIEKRARAGDVAVVLVHGKGSHSPGGQGVLRGEIAAWLAQGRVARHVRAFTTALEEDGGAGALLVLLAR